MSFASSVAPEGCTFPATIAARCPPWSSTGRTTTSRSLSSRMDPASLASATSASTARLPSPAPSQHPHSGGLESRRYACPCISGRSATLHFHLYQTAESAAPRGSVITVTRAAGMGAAWIRYNGDAGGRDGHPHREAGALHGVRRPATAQGHPSHDDPLLPAKQNPSHPPTPPEAPPPPPPKRSNPCNLPPLVLSPSRPLLLPHC